MKSGHPEYSWKQGFSALADPFQLELATSLRQPGIVIAEKIPEIQKLSSEEKLMLVGELWDEIAGNPEAFPPRDNHLKLLRERLEHSRQYPDDVVSWQNVRDRILSSR